MLRSRVGRSVAITLTVMTLTLFTAGAMADGTASGKTSGGAAMSGQPGLPQWPLDPLNNPLIWTALEKGKPRRMLFIQGSLGYNGTDAFVIGVVPTVNGVAVQGSRSIGYCTNQLCDTVSGSWWLDLDAAEEANPGLFFGQTLLVRLIGGEISAATPSNGEWNATLSVQMMKK